ncbi:MAG TPA: hypothetical protein VGL80_16740 [Pseudonocardiaceae bacterium]
MTDPLSFVAGNWGPVHGGHGPQFNGPTFYIGEGERLLRGGRDPRPTARDHLARLARQFVEPPGYGTAQALLAEHGCTILIGHRGIGIRAAGQMLLRRLGGPDAAIQNETGVPDQPGEPVLDTHQVADGDLILLDPTDAEDEDLFRIMRLLPSYRAELRERGAHLVVVLTQDRDDLVRMELRPLLAELERPNALDVVRRHLQVAEIPFAEGQLRANTALRPRLTVEPIHQLAELVRLIGAARERLGDAEGFDAWVAAAFAVLDELGHRVAAQVKEQRTGPQRALLLATAMLIDAPADQVHLAATELTLAAAQPNDERPVLERDDLAQRLVELKIAVDANGHVRFTTFGYEGAVRQYFWTNFPELRPNFRTWARQVGVSPHIGAYHRGEFVSRFADQALRTERPDDIVKLVEAWTTPGLARVRTLPAAAMALERGLGSLRHGSRFRRLIYDWSRDPSLDTGKAQLALALCRDVIAATHPAEALVRLHHFVRRQADDVRAAAEEALLRIVHRDFREFRRLLDRVVTSLTGPRWDADFDLFLTLARPVELLLAKGFLDHTVRESLVYGWQAMLFERPSAFWAELAGEWLSAIENDRRPELWRDTLVRACERPGAGSARLYAVARDWAREPGADRTTRGRIALDLTNRMDQAQGITPTAAPRHRSEESVR